MILNANMTNELNEMLARYGNGDLSVDELRMLKNMLLIMHEEVSDHMDYERSK